MDNRVGVYLLLSLAEYLKENGASGTVYLVASVRRIESRGNPLSSPGWSLMLPSAWISPVLAIHLISTVIMIFPWERAGSAANELSRQGHLGRLDPHPKFRLFIERTIEDLNTPTRGRSLLVRSPMMPSALIWETRGSHGAYFHPHALFPFTN